MLLILDSGMKDVNHGGKKGTCFKSLVPQDYPSNRERESTEHVKVSLRVCCIKTSSAQWSMCTQICGRPCYNVGLHAFLTFPGDTFQVHPSGTF